MSFTVPVAFRQQFHDNFIMLYEQEGSVLDQLVRREPDSIMGAALIFDRIGNTEMVKKTTRHGDTPYVNVPHSRRRVILDFYEWSTLLDRADRVRLSADPSSSYMQKALRAAGRTRDRVILAAMSGSAESISEGLGLPNTFVPLPSGQHIAHGSTGLTLAKLNQTRELMDAAEVPPDDRHIAYSAKQKTNLLNTTEVKSSDYNSVKALVQGDIDTFLGFKFHHTELCETDDDGNRRVMAWHRDAVGFFIGDGVFTNVEPLPTKAYSIQFFVGQDVAGVRAQDEGVVEIACVET